MQWWGTLSDCQVHHPGLPQGGQVGNTSWTNVPGLRLQFREELLAAVTTFWKHELQVSGWARHICICNALWWLLLMKAHRRSSRSIVLPSTLVCWEDKPPQWEGFMIPQPDILWFQHGEDVVLNNLTLHVGYQKNVEEWGPFIHSTHPLLIL